MPSEAGHGFIFAGMDDNRMNEFVTRIGEFVNLGYGELLRITLDAVGQAAVGKGRERHAVDGVAWPSQPIVEETELLGPGFPIGQVRKKAREAMRFLDHGAHDQAAHELRGLIVYAAAAIWFAEDRAATPISLSGQAGD